MSNLYLSVVAPVFKGAESLGEFVAELKKTLRELNQPYEIILVDDGSPDNSWEAITAECASDPVVRGVRLSRNFGQQLAVSAGLKFAKGRYVVMMDADLQNPPEAIQHILERLTQGRDIVYTVSKTRNNRVDELTSQTFWFLINKLLGVGMIPHQLMMKGVNRKFLEIFNSYSERVRVVAGITHDIGMNYDIISVNNRKRMFGSSNYSFFKRFNLMLDMVMVLTTRPLNMLIHASIVVVMGVVCISVYTLVVYFVTRAVPEGYTTLLLLLTFFGGLILLTLGIIGRYLANIYAEVRRRPVFIVRETLNAKDAQAIDSSVR